MSVGSSKVADLTLEFEWEATPERIDVAVEGAGELAEAEELARGQAQGVRELLKLGQVGAGTAVQCEEALEGGVLLLLRVGVVGLEDAAGLGVGIRLTGIEGAQLLESRAGEQATECLKFVDVVEAGAVDAVDEGIPEARKGRRVRTVEGREVDAFEDCGADESGWIVSLRSR